MQSIQMSINSLTIPNQTKSMTNSNFNICSQHYAHQKFSEREMPLSLSRAQTTSKTRGKRKSSPSFQQTPLAHMTNANVLPTPSSAALPHGTIAEKNKNLLSVCCRQQSDRHPGLISCFCLDGGLC